MSKKMAAYIGYPEQEATEVADTVVRATDRAFSDDDDGPSTYAMLDVTFETSEEEMEIRVRYVSKETNTDGRGHGSIKRLLRRRGDGDAPLDVMHFVMRPVEFGRDNGVEFCALTKLLPNGD